VALAAPQRLCRQPAHPKVQFWTLDSLPLPGRVSVTNLPVASTVDPATKSLFRARRFDPDTAQFDLLSDALNGTAPRVTENDLIVVPADAGEPVVEVAPAIITAPLAPIVVAPSIAAAAPILPPLLPVVEAKAKPTVASDVEAQPDSKPEIAAEIEKIEPKKSKRPPLRIVLDPGHGGRDPGTGSEIDVTEKEINLEFAVTLANLLEDDPRYDSCRLESEQACQGRDGLHLNRRSIG